MTTKQLLKKAEKNAVFDLAVKWGFQPSEFRWEEVPGSGGGAVIHRILHMGLGGFFRFDTPDRGYRADFCPGIDNYTESRQGGSRTGQINLADAWLHNLRKEIDTRDLWEEAAQETRLLDAATEADPSNEPFSPTELSEVHSKISELKRFILEAHAIDEEAHAGIETRLDYLSGAATRIGRKDWLVVLASSIVSLALEGLIRSGSVGACLGFAADLLGFDGDSSFLIG